LLIVWQAIDLEDRFRIKRLYISWEFRDRWKRTLKRFEGQLVEEHLVFQAKYSLQSLSYQIIQDSQFLFWIVSITAQQYYFWDTLYSQTRIHTISIQDSRY